MSTERTERAYRSNLNNGAPLLVVYREEREFVLTEGSKRRPKRRLNLIWPEPAEVKLDSAGAADGTPRPKVIKEKPPKGFERSDKRASVICSPGRRRRTESRLLESLRRSNDYPKGATGRADRRQAHHRACKGRAVGADWRRFFDWSLRKSENLRKEAGAGRADSGEPFR